MLHRALLLSVALAGVIGSTNAWAGQSKVAVRGSITAMAFSGDSVIVARQRDGRNFRLERLTPGAPAQTLLRLPRANDPYHVSLEASAQAIAVSVNNNDEDEPSHVYVGPAAGPLREVAACQAGLLLPAIAVSGSRVAWASGGCGQPADEPVGTDPATIVIAGADPATPKRLVPLADQALPTRIVLDGPSELAGVVRPSFFLFFKSEVRRLGAGSLGALVTKEDGGILMPVGSVPAGDTILSLAKEDDDSEDGDGDSDACEQSLFAIGPQSPQRRALSLGGCPTESDPAMPVGGARVAADRVYAIVEAGSPVASGESERAPRALTSARADGSARRILARGGHRIPLGFTTNSSGRVGWWSEGCTGDSEIVIDDGAAPASSPVIPACKLTVLNRSARVRRGAITVRLRCPTGCAGEIYHRSRLLRPFKLNPGTHRFRLRLTPRERRAKRLELRFVVGNGPLRKKVIRLR